MNLDNLDQIKKLDKDDVAGSVSLLGEQIKQVVNDTKNIKLPASYKKVDKIFINGMGGSNLGAWVLKRLFADQLRIPVEILDGYTVPKQVDKNTLFLFSSYSGTTEEVLSTFKEVKKRKAKMLILASGGPLEKRAKKENIPGFIFDPKFNPSTQPRIGLGYSIFGMLHLFGKLGFIKLGKNEITDILKQLDLGNKKLQLSSKINSNPAKKMAKKLHGRMPILVGAEFLMGNVHIFRNQVTETCKTFASFLELPDLNHFAMEGLKYPSTNPKNMLFFFIDSNLYHKRIVQRAHLTKKVVRQNGIEVFDLHLKTKTKLLQSFELLQYGTWLTYYLGILNNVNPAEVPFVSWFKKQLSKHPFRG
ncbi:hypothetical protein C0584_05910 [Candidatus Parcubacteria bacterium]|nr:MAG: hypothetical protein C0584_05910 [Candidatus Parcubacteria bacterium]